MVSTGSSNSWLINWDNSSVGEGLETSIWGISSSIDSWSSTSIDSSVQSLGGKMVSSGGSNLVLGDTLQISTDDLLENWILTGISNDIVMI